jgi:aconitate hydratase
VVDRATIANMAPEYGATMGFFPHDAECVEYLRQTGRSEEHCRLTKIISARRAFSACPKKGDIAYSTDLELDLATVVPSVAGPKRPQDRIELAEAEGGICRAFSKPVRKTDSASPEDLGAPFPVGRMGGRRRAAAARNRSRANARSKRKTPIR